MENLKCLKKLQLEIKRKEKLEKRKTKKRSDI